MWCNYSQFYDHFSSLSGPIITREAYKYARGIPKWSCSFWCIRDASFFKNDEKKLCGQIIRLPSIFYYSICATNAIIHLYICILNPAKKARLAGAHLES